MKIKLKNPKYCDSCPCLNHSEDGTNCNLNHFTGELYNQPSEQINKKWIEIKPDKEGLKFHKEKHPELQSTTLFLNLKTSINYYTIMNHDLKRIFKAFPKSAIIAQIVDIIKEYRIRKTRKKKYSTKYSAIHKEVAFIANSLN